MKSNERIIWQNIDIDIKDYEEFLQEVYPDITDDYDKLSLCLDLNNDYLDDERINLDIQLSNPIIVIADLGLWNGRRSGCSIIDSGNINDILYSNDCDYCKWYADRYNIRFTGHHHDGTNYYMYREVKDMDKIDILTDKLYNGTATQADVTRYTRSIRKHVARVYGW